MGCRCTRHVALVEGIMNVVICTTTADPACAAAGVA
jgi:hypothetical protein